MNNDDTALSRSPLLPQNALQGIAMYSVAVFMVVTMNSFAKMAATLHHPIEIVFYRNLVILAVIVPYLSAAKKWNIVRTRRPRAHIIRSLIGVVSVTLVFYAHKHLPVADATALMYAAPLIITALSGPFLKEHVGIYRWLAVLAGFCGVLVILRPGGGSGEMTGYVFALAAAFTIAAVSLCLRDLGKTEDPLSTVFYFTLIGTVATGAFMPFLGHMPDAQTLWMLAGAGAAGACQQFLKTRALAIAPAATLSPLQFTGLVWAALLGWLFFGHWPSLSIWAGGLLIVSSNLFILWRERQRQKAVKQYGQIS